MNIKPAFKPFFSCAPTILALGMILSCSQEGLSADAIVWNLAPLPGVVTNNSFIDQRVATLRTGSFDSQNVEDAIRDLTLPSNRNIGVPNLCAAMTNPNFTRLFGPSQVAFSLFKDGQKTLAKRMLPFLASVSERCQEAEGLSAFAYISPLFQDLRVVPLLIRLLEHPQQQVRYDATRALAQLTMTPLDKVTVTEMKAWQQKNSGKSAASVWHEGLLSKNPQIAMAAAEMRFDDRDKDIIPALATALRSSEDPRTIKKAREMLERICGNDWGCTAEITQKERAKNTEKLEKWWRTERDHFKWINDRNKTQVDELAVPDVSGGAPGAADPRRGIVEQLGSLDGLQSEQAEAQLKAAGMASVPALIYGLESSNLLIQRKSNKILIALSKKDFGFDPRASASAIEDATNKWKAWAQEQASNTPKP